MTHDVTIIRPEMRESHIKPRGRDLSRAERRAVRKALQTLHMLEIMAVKIYQCQITKTVTPHNTALVTAMANELTHMHDFQTRLYEYGLKPAKLRGRFWLVGTLFGLGSRSLGRRRMLRTGVWAERKAVEHYGKLLAGAEWDEETRAVIEKNRADEYGHIARWEAFLAGSASGASPGDNVDTRPDQGGRHDTL